MIQVRQEEISFAPVGQEQQEQIPSQGQGLDPTRIVEMSLNASKAIHAFHIEVGVGQYQLHKYLEEVYEDLDEFGDSLGELYQGVTGNLSLGIDLNRTPVDEPTKAEDVIGFLDYFIGVICGLSGIDKGIDNLTSTYAEKLRKHISMLLRF